MYTYICMCYFTLDWVDSSTTSVFRVGNGRVPGRGAKYAKIRGPMYRTHIIVCSMQGYSAEYAPMGQTSHSCMHTQFDMDTMHDAEAQANMELNRASLTWDRHRTHACTHNLTWTPYHAWWCRGASKHGAKSCESHMGQLEWTTRRTTSWKTCEILIRRGRLCACGVISEGD